MASHNGWLFEVQPGLIFVLAISMTYHRFFFWEPKVLRQKHAEILELANRAHLAEVELIEALLEVDHYRYFVWLGYKSLRGYCTGALRFSKTQSQRIVTQVRRLEPTAPIGKVDEPRQKRETIFGRKNWRRSRKILVFNEGFKFQVPRHRCQKLLRLRSSKLLVGGEIRWR